MSKRIQEVKAIEDKYGIYLFNMALTFLVDIGHQFLNENTVEDIIKDIVTDDEYCPENKIPIITRDFKCTVIRCASEIAKYSVWEIVAYIKDCVHIG